jgi:hypothetical protein
LVMDQRFPVQCSHKEFSNKGFSIPKPFYFRFRTFLF